MYAKEAYAPFDKTYNEAGTPDRPLHGAGSGDMQCAAGSQSLNATDGTLGRPHSDLRQRRQWRPLPPEDAWTGLPFGNGLTQTYGTVNDGTEPHYTGKERDQESGFDDFGPRYYASSRGRFMSPDPSGLHRADLPECRLRFGDTNRSIQH
jgi:RHS repeat-associated protein